MHYIWLYIVYVVLCACLETDSNVEHSLCYFVFLQVDSNAMPPLLFLILMFLSFFFDQITEFPLSRLFTKSNNAGQVWWHRSLVLALGRQRQPDPRDEFQASKGYLLKRKEKDKRKEVRKCKEGKKKERRMKRKERKKR